MHENLASGAQLSGGKRFSPASHFKNHDEKRIGSGYLKRAGKVTNYFRTHKAVTEIPTGSRRRAGSTEARPLVDVSSYLCELPKIDISRSRSGAALL